MLVGLNIELFYWLWSKFKAQMPQLTPFIQPASCHVIKIGNFENLLIDYDA